MEIRQLRYFVSVAEHKNFTKAADELFVAQSAVSQQISNLEKELDVELFARNRRTVNLTHAGEVFLKEVKDILDKTEIAITNARRAKEGLIGTLKIGFLAAPVRNFLPKLINEFNRKFPTIQVILYHLTMNELNERIKTNDIDLAFTVSIGLQENAILEYETLYSTSTCVYLRDDHPLADRKTIHITELANETFVVRDREEAPQWNDYLIELCVNNGFYPNIISQNRRVETVLMLVDAGLGIAIFPNYLQMYKSSKVLVKAIEGEEDTIDVIVYRNKTNENPTISLFLTELQEQLSNYLGDETSMYI